MRISHAPLRLYQAGIHEPGTTILCERTIQPDWTVADIGAHYGYYSVLFGKLAHSVYVIEADPRNIPTIKNNIRRNGVSADILHLAAYSSTGMIQLHTTRERGTSSIFGGGQPTTVPTAPLDAVIPHLDFFKMDIEGAELEALAGMPRLLKEVRCFIVEFSPKQLWARGLDPHILLGALRKPGFTAQAILRDGSCRSMGDAELVQYAETRGHINLFCNRDEN